MKVMFLVVAFFCVVLLQDSYGLEAAVDELPADAVRLDSSVEEVVGKGKSGAARDCTKTCWLNGKPVWRCTWSSPFSNVPSNCGVLADCCFRYPPPPSAYGRMYCC